MEAADFGKVMLALGLGNQGMADILGINVKLVRAYAIDKRPIPKVVDLACWTLTMRPRVGAVRKLLEV